MNYYKIKEPEGRLILEIMHSMGFKEQRILAAGAGFKQWALSAKLRGKKGLSPIEALNLYNALGRNPKLEFLREYGENSSNGNGTAYGKYEKLSRSLDCIFENLPDAGKDYINNRLEKLTREAEEFDKK